MICSGISPSIYSTRRRSGALKPLIADVDLIVIDNISTLVRTGCENESDSWRPVQEWGLQQRRAGRAVLFVHHTNKSGAQRGTSSREHVMLHFADRGIACLPVHDSFIIQERYTDELVEIMYCAYEQAVGSELKGDMSRKLIRIREAGSLINLDGL
jgi:AAA domain